MVGSKPRLYGWEASSLTTQPAKEMEKTHNLVVKEMSLVEIGTVEAQFTNASHHNEIGLQKIL